MSGTTPGSKNTIDPLIQAGPAKTLLAGAMRLAAGSADVAISLEIALR